VLVNGGYAFAKQRESFDKEALLFRPRFTLFTGCTGPLSVSPLSR
jgi:hypothetical protein